MSNNIYITYNIGESRDSWSVSGNTITGSNHIGSINDQGIDIITNNTPRIIIENDGEIGIGTSPKTGVTINVSGQIYSDLYTHPQVITKNITIPDNSNSFLVSPVGIGTGFTIVVGDNSNLVIL